MIGGDTPEIGKKVLDHFTKEAAKAKAGSPILGVLWLLVVPTLFLVALVAVIHLEWQLINLVWRYT